MSTTTPARPTANIFSEALRPFIGPIVAVWPPEPVRGRSRAGETRRRYEAARQSLLVQQIVAGVADEGTIQTNVNVAQTALAIRGWDSTRWAVATLAGIDWATTDRIEFHCGSLGVAEAVRVTFTAYDLVAGLGPDELSVAVIL